MNIAKNSLCIAAAILTIPWVSGCMVNYTLPELGHVGRPRPIRITGEYLSSVGLVMSPRIEDMVLRYAARMSSSFDDLISNAAGENFPEQDALTVEGLTQIYHSLRVFYGTLHNMESIEQRLHQALYTSESFKPRLRILKRLILTPINLLQVALIQTGTDEIEVLQTTVTVRAVCNYRNVYTFVRKSINDLQTMQNFFTQMTPLVN
ncbi:uncharacterized protein [Argopecten irradians]|uniref:uncharacterized protein n=1 Tax=Argopecten irradians TaxID=31199 RepID=UPI003721E7E2